MWNAEMSQTTHLPIPRQILRLPDVMARTGMRRAFLYREIAAGNFPAPVKIGRASGWDAGAVDAWVGARLAGEPMRPVWAR